MPVAAEWTDPTRYAALAAIGAPDLAWEWVRRDATYHAAWQAAVSRGSVGKIDCAGESAAWGLVRFEDPACDGRAAQPLWSRRIDPGVLVAEADPVGDERDMFDIARWPSGARLLSCACGAEHLLLDNTVRIDIVAGTLRAGPVRLHFRVHGIASARPQLRTLAWLLSLEAGDPMCTPPPRRIDRRLLELRVHDALAEGADHQTIARSLFGSCIAPTRWRIESASYRYRVQRLATAARAMAAGGWRTLFAA